MTANKIRGLLFAAALVCSLTLSSSVEAMYFPTPIDELVEEAEHILEVNVEKTLMEGLENYCSDCPVRWFPKLSRIAANVNVFLKGTRLNKINYYPIFRGACDSRPIAQVGDKFISFLKSGSSDNFSYTYYEMERMRIFEINGVKYVEEYPGINLPAGVALFPNPESEYSYLNLITLEDFKKIVKGLLTNQQKEPPFL